MEKKLNHLLADFVVEYHKLQNFHWYVKGKDFFTAHAKLEEYYDGINDGIDEIAEIILMLDGKPLASLKDFLAESSIEEASIKFVSSDEVFEEVYKDFDYLLKEVKNVKKAADEEEEYLVSAKMDNYIEHFTKALWMIRQRRV